MMFTKRLRPGIREGSITCTVRIWKNNHVKIGGAYRMDDGFVIVDSIRTITLEAITGALARRCGFLGVVDLLKTAKHGSGSNVYLIEFHYIQQPEPTHGRPPAPDREHRPRAASIGAS